MISISRQFACLTYHHIGDTANQYTVSEETLRAQLGFLRAEGYTVEGFDRLHKRLQCEVGLPARYVVLTLDDGHMSAMRAADCLNEYGVSATFFVTRDRSIAKPSFIRPPQIRELRQRGFTLGTHGTTHRKLTQMSEQECRGELAESRSWLEDVLSESVVYTAAPGGFVNSLVMRLAAEEGYLMLANCKESVNVFPCHREKSLQTINRVNVRRYFSAADFSSVVEGHRWFYFRRQLRSAVIWLPKQLLAA